MTRLWLASLTLVLAGCATSTTTPATTTGAATGQPTPTTTATAIAAATAATATTPASASPSGAPPLAPFRITSPAFLDGGAIPSRFTCDGAGVSPEIGWSGAPDGTQDMALTVIDPDANGFVHWLAWWSPAASAGSLPEDVGTGPGAPHEGKNGHGLRGYTGPCPPSGTHHYVFTLSAVDRSLALTGTPTRSELEAAIKGHVLGTATLTGTYKRS